jgi:hypothetical protein
MVQFILPVRPHLTYGDVSHSCRVVSGLNFYYVKQFDVLLGALAKLQKATISFVMSACPSVCLSAWNSPAPTGRIFIKFGI